MMDVRTVTCNLTCIIDRYPPEDDLSEAIPAMDDLMNCATRSIDCRVERKCLDTSTTPPYHNKTLTNRYDIVIKETMECESAIEKLITAFSNLLSRVRDDNVDTSYYLDIKREPDPQYLDSHIDGVEVCNFKLGFFSSPTTFCAQFDYEEELLGFLRKNPTVTIEIDNEKLYIDFAVSSNCRGEKHVPRNEVAPTTEVYRLTIDFKHLSPYVMVDISSGATANLCFQTSASLQLWRTQFRVTDLGKIKEYTEWTRTLKIKSADRRANKCSLRKETLGGCNAFELTLPIGKQLQTIIHSLSGYGSFTISYTVLNYITGIYVSSINRAVSNNDHINWILKALLSIDHRIPYQVHYNDVFLDKLKTYLSTRPNRLYKALCQTYDIMIGDFDSFLHIDIVLDYFMNNANDDEPQSTQNLIKRIVVTPTQMILQPPTLTHENRILREFDPASAVICTFRGEDHQSLKQTGIGAAALINELIGDSIRNGVRAAGRDYQFLGCSGSQLKNTSYWFYAKDVKGKTADDIWKWMGDLEHIRSPSKLVARMGQCFSDTTPTVKISLEEGTKIDWDAEDVLGGRDPEGNPYCFSDGVGRISEECMKLVSMELPDRTIPSAIQIRLGGAKGMLTLDKRLKGKQIIIRKSMNKFKSDHKTVEVKRTTRPIPLQLNRQIITLLSQVHGGVPDHAFISLLNDMLHELADSLLDEKKALKLLSQSGFPCCFSKLQEANFKFTRDPFFKGLLKTIIVSKMNFLKAKTRIQIPPEYGRDMLGVMDEEGVLEYGEVFVQYSVDVEHPNDNRLVLEGPVIVSKMPALHPGDVRKLTAVDKPQLRHLVDCIVFPQKGRRPHPNEMGGSDLDGDEYFVTWHPDLIFKGDNAKPMNFPSLQKLSQATPVTREDLAEFIVDFTVKDKVGPLCNAHLAWADQKSIHSPECENLSEICCHAIDFQKTGYFPEVLERGLGNLRPPAYPDFMEKDDHMESYRSDNVLGKLYRIICGIIRTVSAMDEKDIDQTGRDSNIDQRLFSYPGHETFMKVAEDLYNMYEKYIDAEQRRFGISTEAEVVSGCVLKIEHTHYQSDDVYDIGMRLKKRLTDIQKHLRHKFDRAIEATELENCSTLAKAMRLAAACYVTTHTERRKHPSFPWMFADKLLTILQLSRVEAPLPSMSLLSKSIDSLRDEDASRRFGRLPVPKNKTVVKVMNVLTRLAKEEKCLSDRAFLSTHHFIRLLTELVEYSDLMDKMTSGELMCTLFREITELTAEKSVRIGRNKRKSDTNKLKVDGPAFINLKRQMMIAHHKIARSHDVNCLFEKRPPKTLTKTVHVTKQKWAAIENKIEDLESTSKEKYKVSLHFHRRKQNNCSMFVYGLEPDVVDFKDKWDTDFLSIVEDLDESPI